MKLLRRLINSDSMELGLPQNKLDRLYSLLDSVAGKKSMPVEKMESLIGHLRHFCGSKTTTKVYVKYVWPHGKC